MKKIKCDFSKMGTRIIPRKDVNVKKRNKIEKDKKKRMNEWREWWS